MENSWRQWFSVRRLFEGEMQAPGHLVVDTNDKHCGVSQEEEYDDDCIKVGLSDIDHEGARRCAIIGMHVGNVCSLYDGFLAFWSERGIMKVLLMVTFMDKCVSIEPDGPFAEHKGIGRMQQNLIFFRSASLAQNMWGIVWKKEDCQ